MKFYRYFHNTLPVLFIALFFALSASAQTQSRNLRIADFLKNSGQYEQALALYLKAYHSGQQNFIVINNIQKCYEELKQYADLIAFLKDVIRKNPGNLEYQIKLGRAYYLNNQPERAYALWDSLLKSNPKNIYMYRSLGANLIQLRLYDRAIQVYQAAIKHIPRQKSLYREIAMIYRAQLNYAEALRNYLNYYRAYPAQYGYIRSQVIAMSSDTTAIEPMIGVLRKFEDARLPGLPELLADLYLRRKDFSAGFDIYVSMYKKTGEQNYLLRFANKASQAGAYDFAVKALRMLLKQAKSTRQKHIFQLNLARSYYEWAEQLTKIGKQKQALQKIAQAEHFADALLKAEPRSGYWWAACELKGDVALKYDQDLDGAIDWYQKVLGAGIDIRYKDRVRLKLAQCYLMKGDLAKSEQMLRFIKSGQYANLANYKKAEILFYEGKLSQARTAFQKLSRTLSPEDSLANNVLARMLLLEHSRQDSAILVRYAQAELRIRQDKLSEAARTFEELAQKHSALSARCAEQAVNLFIRLKKFDRARTLIRQIEEKFPDYVNNDRLYFLLASSLQKQQQWQEAFAAYQALIDKYPDSFFLEQARENARFIRNRYLKGQVE